MRIHTQAVNPAYNVIQTDDPTIPSLPIARDCVVILWVPDAARLVECLESLRRWRVKYKTSFLWKFPTARPADPKAVWPVRENGQLGLLATRGQPPAPVPGTQLSSVVEGNGRAVISAWLARDFPSSPHLYLWAEDHA